MPALMALLVAGQMQRSSALMKAQRLLYSVERRTLEMLRTGEIDKAKLRAHLAALSDARALDPAEVAIPMQIGSQYMMLGELEPARSAYFEALRLEMRPEILVNLGKVRYGQGARPEAIRLFRKAVLLDPRMQREVPPDLKAAVSNALRRKDDANRPDED
jgi:Flp pilus assembly protein TadD